MIIAAVGQDRLLYELAYELESCAALAKYLAAVFIEIRACLTPHRFV